MLMKKKKQLDKLLIESIDEAMKEIFGEAVLGSSTIIYGIITR